MVTFLLHNRHISSYNDDFGFSNIKSERQFKAVSRMPALELNSHEHSHLFELVIIVANNVFDSIYNTFFGGLGFIS
jgi:hypothetical protein